MTTSTAYLKIEVQAHSALATVGRIHAAFAGAGVVVWGAIYIPYQAFRIWRKMRTLAGLILTPDTAPKPSRALSDDEVRHSLALMRELYQGVHKITNTARTLPAGSTFFGPMLPAIERDTEILGSFLEEAEMKWSAEFQASLRDAIAELKPPTGTDWRASLEAMRH